MKLQRASSCVVGLCVALAAGSAAESRNSLRPLPRRLFGSSTSSASSSASLDSCSTHVQLSGFTDLTNFNTLYVRSNTVEIAGFPIFSDFYRTGAQFASGLAFSRRCGSTFPRFRMCLQAESCRVLLKCLHPGSGRKIPAIWQGAGAYPGVFIPKT